MSEELKPQSAEQIVRCKCGKPHDNWPGKDGGQLCYMCWESECSESWWHAVKAIDAARRVEVPDHDGPCVRARDLLAARAKQAEAK